MTDIGRTRTQPDPAATQWPIVWVAFGGGVVAAAHIGKLPPALPIVQADLDAGLVTAGWIASMISATGCALGLVAGAIADRLGHRAVLISGLASLAIGGLIGAFALTGAMMLVARFIEGIGFTATTVAGGAIIARATNPADRGWALGVWAAYMPLGFAGMMIVSALLLHVAGWRYVWAVGCGLALIWILVTVRATANWQLGRRRQRVAGFGFQAAAEPLREAGAVLVAVCFALYAAQHISMMNWLPTYMGEVYGSGILVAALVPVLVLGFNGTGNFLAARAMGAGWPIWALLTIGSAGMAIAELAVFSGLLPDVLRLLFAFLFGLAGGLIPAAALASPPIYARSYTVIGSMSGIMVMGSNTGQFFGPPALATARQWTGSWDGTVWLLLSLAIGGTLLALASRPMEKKANRMREG